MKLTRAFLLALVATAVSGPAGAEGSGVGTLELDGLSFLSFENIENLAIPAGSTIRFRFDSAVEGGVATFKIRPNDVEVAAIPLPGGEGEILYSLAEQSTGTLRQGEDGYIVSFVAKVNATLLHPTSGGTRSHVLHFTTEHAQATGSASQQTVSLDGMQMVPGPRYVQIVGAVPNPEQAHPHPGRAVYTVLSGTFDWVPDLD